MQNDMMNNNIRNAWIIEDNPLFFLSMASQYNQHPEVRENLKTLAYMQPYNQSEWSLIGFLDDFMPVVNWLQIRSEVLA